MTKPTKRGRRSVRHVPTIAELNSEFGKKPRVGKPTKAAPNGTVGGLPVVGKLPVKAKVLKDGTHAVFVPGPLDREPPPEKKKRRRRRRRRSQQLLSARLITEVNQKKRTFLRDVSQMLTDALGFEVRVTLVKPKVDMTPDMRRASRMTKAQSARQIAESAGFGEPVTRTAAKGSRKSLNDPLPF